MRCQTALGRGLAVGLALLGLHPQLSEAFRAAQDPASLAPPEVCEFKTINYITHTLPQQCLRTSWSAATPTATAEATATDSATAAPSSESTTASEPAQDQGQDKDKEDEETPDFATGSFMSFEEWKEMMLRKSGQDPAKLKDRKPHEHKADRDPAAMNGEYSIGEEGEISIGFDALSEKVSELASSSSDDATPGGSAAVEEQVLTGDGKAQYYRSKDAGKTCKERFSYSSFDAGATILKTSPGAKNANSILVENKDSYMLLECRSKNKFVIVELSDDILVDTVVLANFEFFSSMIRKFRVSVSDRYPPKADKWVDLGTFEARNSRDIQPFLVEHPQIYTKYVRIEFLSHYGNEYYCPVSLLRVHGTRMLDSWKEPDNSQDDDPDQIDAPAQEPVAEGNQTQEVPLETVSSSTVDEIIPEKTYVTEMGLSPWQPMFYYNFSEETCIISSPTTGDPTPVTPDHDSEKRAAAGRPESVSAHTSKATVTTESPQRPTTSVSAAMPSRSTDSQSQSAGVPSQPPASASQQQAESNSSATTISNSRPPTPKAETVPVNAPSGSSRNSGSATPSSTTTSRNKTSASSSAASASPTVQESFFKTVTKRLQLLESNTSLSLQYIEEQSRFLQDALLKMEKKQAGRVDAFLDNLNNTVLAELHSLRQQYDQIWQSTVIALETQREQTQRENVALSSRVAVLADEIVFQKRMAILQSVLLLSCLVLVIFSRGGGGPTLSSYGGSFGAATGGFGSPSSPPPGGGGASSRFFSSPPPPDNTSHIRHHHHHQREKILPMTPTSQFSREDTPLIHVDDVGVGRPFLGGDSSPSPPQLLRRRSRTVSSEGTAAGGGGGAEGIGEEDEFDHVSSINGGETEGSLREDHRYMSQTEFGGVVTVDQESTKPLSKGRSGISQLSGAVRKPLPALPEDPS
ncbi:UNC-like C-terminal-domain-containing protein [Echria macrotheca]|uniref:UNC-like C-terminal-domain-containing protein n=1 Tax=Echria macrotheca TaxID=438768 RepID=A0AAJ0BDG4_9PEZI|nr:UNC-like C-terminal-domain-containing protein [Echria macrotheca]